MPSFQTLSKAFFASVQIAIFFPPTTNLVRGGAPASCPAPLQLSCHNTTVIKDTCCFAAPGGQLLQTQFWDTDPETGPSNSWTIHGLWPDNCDGTYQQFCDPNRQYTNITQILQSFGATSLLSYMNTYWKNADGTDESFWEHEWGKHGTCISTFDTNCYTGYQPGEEVVDFFNKTVQTFQTLNTYEFLAAAGIIPSSTTTYTATQINAALKAPRGVSAVTQCVNSTLDEVWYFYDIYGSVQTGTLSPQDPVGSTSNCPAAGIQYLPKTGSPAPTTSTVAPPPPPSSTSTSTKSTSTSKAAPPPPPTTTTSTTTTIVIPPPTSTTPSSPSGSPFSGKGYLNVYTLGSQDGCIISKGTWYTTGTCATFTATVSGTGSVLTSSKGPCGIVENVLSCGSGVAQTVFTNADGALAYSGSSSFYAGAVPSGSVQAQVEVTSDAVELSIEWEQIS